MNTPSYHIKGLKHSYNRHPVLMVDDLRINPATITGLIGPNGSGKSTLLKLLAFVEKPVTGQILFQGDALLPFSEVVRSQGITLLTQEPYLLRRTVKENIAYGLRVRGDTSRLSARIAQALQWVGLDTGTFLKRPWHELSGGEAQRVALAARLILKPRVLLLDEPTASIDADSAFLIKDASLRARKEWGTTLVIASHDWHWLYEICDDVLHFYAGRVFRSRMMSFISGPWEPGDAGTVVKRTADRQCIRASRPPHAGTVAMVTSDAITISRAPDSRPPSNDSPPAGTNRVVGTLTRLLLEKSTGLLVVTVVAGRSIFSAKVSREQIEADRMVPGNQVAVAFDVAAVRWLAAKSLQPGH